MAERRAGLLDSMAAEIEAHVAQAGWDQRPALFALVDAAQFAQDEPATAARLGIGSETSQPDGMAGALVPIEQEPLPDGALDEVLARLAWPESIAGIALSQEILILPPSAQDAVDSVVDAGSVEAVAAHPDRREARLVVAVLRDGTSACVLRLRASGGAGDDLLTGPDLAPNLVAALLATLSQ